MAETQRKLVTRWGFQVDLKPLEKMHAAIAEMKSGIKGLALEAAGAAIVLFEMAETTAKLGKETALNAQKTGLSTDSFQELAFAAKKTGVDAESLVMSMARLNRATFEAKTGNKEAIKTFMQLGGGVAQAAMSGKSTEEVFMKISERISGMKDQAAKTALVMSILGRSGFQMLPLLNKGPEGIREWMKEAKELGLVLDETAIKKSQEFQEELHGTESLVLGIKRSIGVGLLEPMTEVLKSFSAWIKANRELIKQNLTGLLQGLGNVLKITLVMFNAIAGRLTELIQPLGGVGAMIGYVAAGFAIFKSYQIVTGIGNVISSMLGLAKATEVVAAGAVATDAAFSFWPLIIGVAVLAVIAIIEDLIGFFQGKDSLIGRFLGVFKTEFPTVFAFLAKMIGETVDEFKAMWEVAKVIINGIGTAYGWVRGLFPNKDSDKSMPMDPKLMQGFEASLPNSMSAKDAQGFGMSTPNSSSLAPGQMVGGNNINSNITVNVPIGTDPHLVGDRVEDGVSKALNNIIGPANQTFIPRHEF